MKTVWRCFKKLLIELPYDPAVLLLSREKQMEFYHRNSCNYTDSSTNHNSQDVESPSISSNKYMDKDILSTHTIKYYSAIKKDEILLFATKYLGLEIIILSKLSQIKKNEFAHFPSFVVTYKNSFWTWKVISRFWESW